jgi:hypothetical protein
MPTIADIVNAKNTAVNAIADAIHIIDEEKNKPGADRSRLNKWPSVNDLIKAHCTGEPTWTRRQGL